VTPSGRVVDISAQETVGRRTGAEDQVLAAVIAADEAWFTGTASNMRFDGNAITHAELGNCWMHGNHHASGFVAQDVRVGDLPGTDATMLPEVNVGTTYFSINFVVPYHDNNDRIFQTPLTYPHIPVDLIAIVTSPASRPLPVVASWTEGAASSSQRLRCGSMYMPTFKAMLLEG